MGVDTGRQTAAQVLEDLTWRPSHLWAVPSVGTKRACDEPLVSPPAWLEVFLIGFLFRGIKLTLAKNTAYLVQRRKIGFRFRVSVQMQNKLSSLHIFYHSIWAKQNANDFAILDLNVSTFVSDTNTHFYLFRLILGGKEEG